MIREHVIYVSSNTTFGLKGVRTLHFSKLICNTIMVVTFFIWITYTFNWIEFLFTHNYKGLFENNEENIHNYVFFFNKINYSWVIMEQYFYWGLKRNTKSLFGPPLVWSKTTLSNKIANFDVFGPKILRNGVLNMTPKLSPSFLKPVLLNVCPSHFFYLLNY